jgi:two-component system cell cycle response regulator DivK
MSEGKILLIEDNAQNAYLCEYLLRNAGMDLHIATRGKEGLDWAISHQPPLVLLDIQLPDMDGYQIATELKKRGDTPIIALTSFAMAGEKKKALALGCDGYIEKPIQPLKFVEQVRSFLPKPTA